MAADPALSDIKEDILRIVNQRDESLANLPIPLEPTADGSTTTIVDTKLMRGSGQTNRFDARQGEWLEDAGTNGPGIGRKFAVDDGGFAAGSGTLTVSQVGTAWSAASDQSDDYLLYALGLSPEHVEGHINQVLRQTRGPHIYFPSLFTDSDFNSADLTNWPDDTTPGTQANEFVTGSAFVLLGQRSIHFTASAADQGVKSLDVAVHEGEQVLFACWVKCVAGSVDVILYDTTNTEAIKTVTVDEKAWTLVSFVVTIPDNCEQVRLRLQSNASADDIYLAAHVILQSLTGNHYPLPNWWDAETQINGWGYMPLGRVSEDADSYVALSAPFQAHDAPQIVHDELAVTPMRLIMDSNRSQEPVFVNIQREFSEITMGAAGSNATTTPIDREFIVYRTVANIMRDMGDETFRGWNRMANERARLKQYHRRGVWIDPNPLVSV